MLSMRSVNLIKSSTNTARKFTTSSILKTHGIKTLGVIGSGQMGLGIAYVAAKTAKVNVLITDSNESQLTKGFAFIDKLLAKDVAKGRITQTESDATRSRLSSVNSIEQLSEVDIAIEAVSESLALKQKIFASLATHLSPTAILASNTSSISLTSIAASAIPSSSKALTADAASASRVVGFHFFNPVPVMTLVELIPSLQTSPEVLARAKAFAIAMGKEVTISKDTPGFVSNRVLMPMINEAILALEEGVATREDIDKTLKLGANHVMGPLVLADFIGLDTCLSIMQVLQRETGDTKYRPSVLLGRMVAAGYMGKKSGKGFYDY